MGKNGRKVKRLVPAGKKPQVGHMTVTSLKVARKLTSKFHQLLGQQQKIQNSNAEDDASKKQQLAAVASEMEAMGGRDAYQAASILSQQNAMKSARYVFKTLARFGLQPQKGEPPLRVLEIGAINPQISAVPWLHVRAIDLLSQHPAVETRDFLQLPVGSGPGPDSSHAGASKVAGITFAALQAGSATSSAVKDAILAPVASRLKAVDWQAVRSEAMSLSRGSLGAGRQEGEGKGREGGKHNKHAGFKRQRPAEEGETVLHDRHGGSIIFMPMPGVGTASGSSSASKTSSTSPSHAQVFVCPHRSSGAIKPLCGGYDILVCSMVINCVPDPASRTELLIRCRDHLVPGGLLYLSLPSRCLDMSQYITRQHFEALLTALGFVLRDAKMTPKISLYMLQRCDVVTYSEDLQPVPQSMSTSSGSAPVPRKAPWLWGAGQQPVTEVAPVPLSTLSPSPSSSSGYGKDWQGRIVPATPGETALLTRKLAGPLVVLPAQELPVTGFTRTEFGLTVSACWVAGAAGSTSSSRVIVPAGSSSAPGHARSKAFSAAQGQQPKQRISTPGSVEGMPGAAQGTDQQRAKKSKHR